MPLRQVADGEGDQANQASQLDIVAVHGLNPWNKQDHAFDTWRKPEGPNGHLWLRDDLPKVLPNARIFIYQYDSSPAFGSSKERFVHQANDLLENVRIERRKTPRKPLIFFGHSLGGILIKQALVNAHNNPKYTSIRESTRGLVFFGTPHGGGKDALVTLGNACTRIVTSLSTNPSSDIMQALKSGSLFSDVLQESWRHQLSSYKIISFYEGVGDIVPRASAVLGLPGDVENQVQINASHSDMCRFNLSVERDRDNYRLVEANIEDICDLDLISQGLFQTDREMLQLQLRDIGEKEQKEIILTSLSYDEMFDRYDKIADAHKQTFGWVYDDPGPGFLPWLQEGKGIFWIRGKPGSGKSTLMKHLFEDKRTFTAFQRGSRSLSPARAGFFFHDRGSELQKSLAGLLRGILYQLLCQFDDLVLRVLPMYSKSKHLGTSADWSREEELLLALSAITDQDDVRGDTLLFIDGLDEYHGDHSKLLDWLRNLADPSTQHGLKLKLCVSSRLYNVFQDSLAHCQGFIIHDLTSSDITVYVRSTLQRRVSTIRPFRQDQAELLFSQIVEKASGVFIWVRLVVDDLLQGLVDGDTISQLQERITWLSGNLEELYSQILERINPRYLHETRTLFQILRDARGRVTLLDLAMINEPLDWPEELHAAQISDAEVQDVCSNMKRRLRGRCGGLIEVQDESLADQEFEGVHQYQELGNGGVQFIHQTAKEFLGKPENWKAIETLNEPNLETSEVLLGICLQLYRKKAKHVKPFWYPKSSTDPSSSWNAKDAFVYGKALEVNTGRAHTAMIDQIGVALDKLVTFYKWSHSDFKYSMLPFSAISANLLLYVSSKLSSKDLAITTSSGSVLLFNTLSPYGEPAFASISVLMLRLLLANGADPNDEFELGLSAWQRLIFRLELRSPFSLNREAFQHWLALCHLMLKHGADPNAELPISNTAFLPDANDPALGRSQGDEYTYPLQYILKQGRAIKFPGMEELAERLLECGADPNVRDALGQNAIDVANGNTFSGAKELLAKYTSITGRLGRLIVPKEQDENHRTKKHHRKFSPLRLFAHKR